MIRCTLPWTQLSITAEGEVHVCCWSKPVGKMKDFPTLEAAWNGEGIRAFRRAMVADRALGICSAVCPHWVEGDFAADRFQAPVDAAHPRQAVARALALGQDSLPVPPLRIMASPDDKCSLRCIMCNQNTGTFRLHQNFWTLVEASASALEELCLLGGEPFYSDQVIRFLKHAADHAPSYEFSFITSLSHLPLPLLGKLRIKEIMVSIDGATKATYESVRVGARWETMTSNLSRLLEFRRERAEPFYIHVNYAVMSRNFHEIPRAVRWFDGLGVPVNFSPARFALGHPEDVFGRQDLEKPLYAAVREALEFRQHDSTRMSLELMLHVARTRAAIDLHSLAAPT